MLSNELKSKIDGLWDDFAAGGLSNPLEVIEQITYMMFIHDIDVTDQTRVKESMMLGTNYQSKFDGLDDIRRWSKFKDQPSESMFDIVKDDVFPFIKNLHDDKDSAFAKYMSDAIFKIPTPLLLSKVVDTLNNIYDSIKDQEQEDNKTGKASDIRGDLYEYMLLKLKQAGRNGQFRTPRNIINMMVELVDPTPQDTICDPAFGSAGFLISVSQYLRENKKKEVFQDRNNFKHYQNDMFHGYDIDRTMLRIGAMNMMTHGIDNPQIEYHDSLSDQNTDKDKYSLILANPPFKGSLDADTVSADLLKVCKTKKTELLFVALFLRMLKQGGRCACIVPDGVLFGASKAHKEIRKKLVEDNMLQAVISMPSGVFKPYAGVSTAVLIFTKTGHGGTDKVWFYDMTADGFSLDDKRTPVEENDIPDIINRFRHLDQEADRKRTDKSFFVDKDEIVENGYDLSINRYKEIEYVPVEYPPTKDILAEIMKLDAEADKELQELKKMLEK